MNRRQFLATAGAFAATSTFARFSSAAPSSRSATTRATETIPDNLTWHDVRDWGVEGRAFDDTENYFDRLPARAKSVVRPEVWNLARNTAGISVRFETDADAIYVRYTITGSSLAMPHMPATGMSGADLYARDEKNAWRWSGTAMPREQTVVTALAKQLNPAKRLYQINFPLYNGVKSFEVGVAKDATFSPVAPRKEKPVLFYGTSVTQGGCASRPGMSFTHILGRRLDRPMLNFGFSGNGRMEVEVARFLAELDPAVFVLDCLANMGQLPPGDITARTIAVVKLLREKHGKTPILLLDERTYANAALIPHRLADHQRLAGELHTAYEKLIADGIAGVHYQAGDDLIGADSEATVDGSHPTDLGMVRYADALEPTLRGLLQR
jgi:hypothetical protein